MKHLTKVFVLGLSAVAATWTFADQKSDGLKAELQGNWTAVGLHDGTGSDPVDGRRMWIDGDRMGIGDRKDFDVGTLTLDAGKSPVEFDAEPRPDLLNPARKLPPAVHGICKLEGDQFTMAFVPCGDRPDNFELADKKLVMVFRRKRPSTGPTSARVAETRP